MAADFDPKRLEKAWARYTAKATKAHTPFTTYLNDGATSNQIDSAERAVRCEFPADLRQLLSLHNGSMNYHVLPGWELFSAERIADEWKIWEDLYRAQFKPENYNCVRWIPFCGDGGGNHLCVDMEPAEGGISGQVITMWHNDARRELIANSLTEFIEIIAGDFERGVLTWDEECGGVYSNEA